MTTATVTSKGQITIPAKVRARLAVAAGDRIEFVEVAPGRFQVVAAPRSITRLKGMFRMPRPTVTVEQINSTIRRRGASRK